MSNFKTVKISDPRISNVTDKLDVGVFSGPAEVTMNKFKANTVGASNWNFQCNIPSPNIIIDRNLYVGATVNFQITVGPMGSVYGDIANAPNTAPERLLTGAQIPAGDLCIGIGGTDALQAFALNQLFSTASVTINNSSTSVQSQSILQALLRSSSAKVLTKYNGGTPALSDRFWLNYIDAIASATSNVLADVQGFTFSDEYCMTRGAHPIQIISIAHTTYTYGGAAQYTITNPVVNESLISVGLQDSWVIGLSTVLYEPLIGLAPFLWEGMGSKYNSQGIYGINAMSFNMTIDSTMSRFWSTCDYPVPSGWKIALGCKATNLANSATLAPFDNVNLFMKFLTIQPSDAERLPLKNIVPYCNYTQYITSQNTKFSYSIAAPLSYPPQTLNTITMSLAVVPDLIYVMVRIPQSQMNPFLSSSYFTITGIVCQFNNKSGILSNYNSFDLYQLSVKNGLKDCSYIEWSGAVQEAVVGVNTAAGNGTPAIPAPTTADFANFGYRKNTAGSLLILSPADFGLPDWCAPGVSLQANLQFSVTCVSNYQQLFINGAYTYDVIPEVNILVQESGLFITESGQSSVEIAILSKDDVLDSKSSTEHVPIDEYNDEIGGSIHNRNRSAMKHFPKRHHEHHIRHAPEHGAGMSAGAHHAKQHRLKKYIV